MEVSAPPNKKERVFQLAPLCYPLHKALGQIILWRFSRWMTSPAHYLSSVFYLLFTFGGLLIFFTSFSLLCYYYNILCNVCQHFFYIFSISLISLTLREKKISMSTECAVLSSVGFHNNHFLSFILYLLYHSF